MKNKKQKENLECPSHQQPLILFCNEPRCKVSICALCIPESHPLHNVIRIESKAEQGKKILRESSESAKQLRKKYVDDCSQLDLAIKRVHNIGKEVIDAVNERERSITGHLCCQVANYATSLRDKVSAYVSGVKTRLKKEKELISTSERKMNSLVKRWETTTRPQEILSEANAAFKKISEVSNQLKELSISEFRIPQFIPGNRENISVENYFGFVSTENMPLSLPQTISESGTLKFPTESTTGQETSPIKEFKLQMEWRIRDGRCNNPPLWNIEDGIRITQICAVGDKIVVLKQCEDQSRLIAFDINGDIVCSTHEGHSSISGKGEVTDMAEVIPENSDMAYLMTSHRERNELIIWQLDKERIEQCRHHIDYTGRKVQGGCPEWICSAGKGNVYLVSGKSPHQTVQMLGVVAAPSPFDTQYNVHPISPKFFESKRVHIGLAEITGVACIKPPNKEDILVFSSSALDGALVGKTASTLQTLWRIGNSYCDYIIVKNMCVDPKRHLLYLVHEDLYNDQCNTILVYDAERVRFSQVNEIDESSYHDSYDIGAETIESVAFCQDRLVVKVNKVVEGNPGVRANDAIIRVHTLKYTKEA